MTPLTYTILIFLLGVSTGILLLLLLKPREV